jgi:hypothetical protein
MTNQNYNNCKALLIYEAKEIKRSNGNDKGYLRYELNCSLDRILKDFERQCLLTEKISQKQFNLYSDWLTNITIKFHPKN